jgi:hypothetical protein
MAVGDYHGDEDVLGRAPRVLRAAPEPGWRTLESKVLAAVRATPRGGWPLDVDDPRPDAVPGVLRVSDLVLSTALSRALRGDPSYQVTDIDITSEGGVLQGVSITISGRYGADLTSAGARVRRQAAAVVADVVGASSAPVIEVDVTDIHR